MKYFYIFSVLGVIALSLAPYLLIPASGDKGPARSNEMESYTTYGAKIRTLDPATCGDTTSAALQGNIFESLMAYDYLKRPSAVVPQLAEAMPEVSPDGLTYTFKIKKDVKYHRDPCFGRDAAGEPKTRTVTADDFVLAFKRIADFHISTPLALAFIEDKIAGLQEYRDKTRAYAKGDFSRYDLPLDGVKAIDEHTLQIKLREPFPQLIFVQAINVYAPVPREMVDYYLAMQDGKPLDMNSRVATFSENAVVGTGPYYLKKYTSGGEIVLERNPDFRDEYYPKPPEDLSKLSEEERKNVQSDVKAGLYKDAGKKIPFIDRTVWQYVAEENPMWNMFFAGLVDVSGVPRSMFNQIISPSQGLIDKWSERGIRLLKYNNPAVYWLAFNMEDPVLSKSKSLRQALQLAYNVEAEIDVLNNGRGIRAVNTVPRSIEDYDKLPASPYAKFDIVQAREKIEQARKELVAAGIIKEGQDIPTLTLDLGGRDEETRKMAEFTMKQFKKIGVKLNIEMNDWPTLQQKVENKQTQIYAMGWQADYPDAENFLQLYYTPNIKRGTNNTNYSNPKFDELFEKAVTMQPSPQRTKLYAEMIGILNEDCPMVLLSEPISFVLIHDWVSNVKPHPFGYGFMKYQYIDMAKRAAARSK